MDEDARRLKSLGYNQEFRRIFGPFANYCITASMVSTLLGVVPLYPLELKAGGPEVMFYSWLVIGTLSLIMVLSLSEISSAMPTMGAVYYWSYVLGGREWGPFAAWLAGWTNLLGQVAGLASGSYSGAIILSDILYLLTKHDSSKYDLLGYNISILVIAGVVNIFPETVLTPMSYISAFWQIVGIMVIVIWMLIASRNHLQSPDFVFGNKGFNNDTGFTSIPFVVFIGCLSAATTFTGYDTGSHISEETKDAHYSTPFGMIFAVISALVMGLFLIASLNFCVQSIPSLLLSDDDSQTQGREAYTELWLQSVGYTGTVIFLFIVLIAVEFSNCANLTSAARCIYAFSRDNALPCSDIWYYVDNETESPSRAVWLSVFLAFLLCLPSLWNSAVLGALFSLTATGLYASYIIPIFLRATTARDSFKPSSEFNLGCFSLPFAIFAIPWGLLMISILSLPSSAPVDVNNFNYAPIMLIIVLAYALVMWECSAKSWFKVKVHTENAVDAIAPYKSFDSGTDSGTENERLRLVS